MWWSSYTTASGLDLTRQNAVVPDSDPSPEPSKTEQFFAALWSGLEAVTPTRLFLLAAVTALIILHGLVPSAFVVDGTTIGLLVILVVVALVPILRSASLPGGAGLEFDLDRLRQESQLAEDEQEEHEISTSGDGPAPPDVEEEVLEERLQSADAVVAEVLREAWGVNPKVGLMVLSAELDRAVRELLLGTGWGTFGPSLEPKCRRRAPCGSRHSFDERRKCPQCISNHPQQDHPRQSGGVR